MNRLVILLIFFFIGCEETSLPHTWNLEGNRLFDENKYDQAREKYDQGLEKLPESSLLLYNKAATFYLEKKWDEALDSYARAQEFAYREPRSEDYFYRIAYNTAGTIFRKAQTKIAAAKEEKDHQEAMDLLAKSIEQFKKSLEYLPNDPDTLHNVEYVSKVLKEYRDQLEAQRKKQEEELKNSPTYLLQQIREKQRKIQHQVKELIVAKKDFVTLASKEQTLIADLENFQEKLKKKMEENFDSEKIKQLPAMQQMQVQQGQKMMEGLLSSLKEGTNKSSQLLAKENATAVSQQYENRQMLNSIWYLLSQPGEVLQDDIFLQSQSIEKTQELNSEQEQELAWNIRELEEARNHTQVLPQKMQTMKMLEEKLKLLAPKQDKSETQEDKDNSLEIEKEPEKKTGVEEKANKLKEEKENAEKIQKLIKEALEKQEEALGLLETNKTMESLPHQEKALELLQEVAKMMSPEQEQQKREKQEQDQKQEQQKQEKQEQDQKQEQNEKQEKQEQQNQQDKQSQENEKNKEQQDKEDSAKKENEKQNSQEQNNDETKEKPEDSSKKEEQNLAQESSKDEKDKSEEEKTAQEVGKLYEAKLLQRVKEKNQKQKERKKHRALFSKGTRVDKDW